MTKYYIGMDLCKDYTQLSYYNEMSGEPESVSQSSQKESYLLPNVLFYSDDLMEWFVGNEAISHRFREKGVLIENWQEGLYNSQSIEIDGKRISYEKIFEMLITGHIGQFLQTRESDAEIGTLVVTIPDYSKVLYDALLKVTDYFGIEENQLAVISHNRAFLLYICHQGSELRNNCIGLCDFSTDSFHYYRLDVDRKSKPIIYQLREIDYSEQMDYNQIFTNGHLVDDAFFKHMTKELESHYFSAFYLTGVGFSENWPKRSLKLLCSGRRVFMGQNIYTKGACYGAFFGLRLSEGDYAVDSPEIIPFDVGINGEEERVKFLPIALGGTEWYNMRGQLVVFLDETNRVEFLYHDKVTKNYTKETVEIQGLPKRPNKTTKLSLTAEFYSPTEGAIIIRDMGFGSLYPTTRKIYRKEIVVERDE